MYHALILSHRNGVPSLISSVPSNHSLKIYVARVSRLFIAGALYLSFALEMFCRSSTCFSLPPNSLNSLGCTIPLLTSSRFGASFALHISMTAVFRLSIFNGLEEFHSRRRVGPVPQPHSIAVRRSWIATAAKTGPLGSCRGLSSIVSDNYACRFPFFACTCQFS